MGDNPNLYGISTKSKVSKAKDFLLKTNIEKIFPKELIETAFDFDKPHLVESDIEELKLKHEAYKNNNPDSLNGSIFVDMMKDKLSQLQTANMSQKDKKQLSDLIFLLERIGEVKVYEARLLSRLFEIL